MAFYKNPFKKCNSKYAIAAWTFQKQPKKRLFLQPQLIVVFVTIKYYITK
jgi:hypothetical protein